MMGNNQTTVGKTSIGGAIAVILVFAVGKFGVALSAEEAALIVGAFTTVFNWVIPADYKPFGK